MSGWDDAVTATADLEADRRLQGSDPGILFPPLPRLFLVNFHFA